MESGSPARLPQPRADDGSPLPSTPRARPCCPTWTLTLTAPLPLTRTAGHHGGGHHHGGSSHSALYSASADQDDEASKLLDMLHRCEERVSFMLGKLHQEGYALEADGEGELFKEAPSAYSNIHVAPPGTGGGLGGGLSGGGAAHGGSASPTLSRTGSVGELRSAVGGGSEASPASGSRRRSVMPQSTTPSLIADGGARKLSVQVAGNSQHDTSPLSPSTPGGAGPFGSSPNLHHHGSIGHLGMYEPGSPALTPGGKSGRHGRRGNSRRKSHAVEAHSQPRVCVQSRSGLLSTLRDDEVPESDIEETIEMQSSLRKELKLRAARGDPSVKAAKTRKSKGKSGKAARPGSRPSSRPSSRESKSSTRG